MTDVYSDEYWLYEFTITTADLNRFQDRILRDKAPLDTTSLVRQLVKGRLEYGHDISPSVLRTWTGKDSVRIWDPLKKWSVNDGIIVPRDIGNSSYECFIGNVISVDEVKPNHIEIRLDGQNEPVIFRYGNPTATEVGEFSKNLVEKKYGEVDYIVIRFGNRIASALLHALEMDERFIGLEGKWYLKDRLLTIDTSILKSAHHALLEKDFFVLDDIFPMIPVDTMQNEILLKMAIQYSLQQMPEQFEILGTYSRPIWRSLPPLPEKARVNHYAYDPKTYEVLCSPGQPLDLEKAHRLMDLNLYKFIVTFKDGD